MRDSRELLTEGGSKYLIAIIKDTLKLKRTNFKFTYPTGSKLETDKFILTNDFDQVTILFCHNFQKEIPHPSTLTFSNKLSMV